MPIPSLRDGLSHGPPTIGHVSMLQRPVLFTWQWGDGMTEGIGFGVWPFYSYAASVS